MTPSQNKHDPYTNMVSYESTPSGDHNMSICRQGQKTYSRDDSAKSGPIQNFYPRDYLFSRSFRTEKKIGGIIYEKNLAMQDTTNLEPGGGVWVVLAWN